MMNPLHPTRRTSEYDALPPHLWRQEAFIESVLAELFPGTTPAPIAAPPPNPRPRQPGRVILYGSGGEVTYTRRLIGVDPAVGFARNGVLSFTVPGVVTRPLTDDIRKAMGLHQ